MHTKIEAPKDLQVPSSPQPIRIKTAEEVFPQETRDAINKAFSNMANIFREASVLLMNGLKKSNPQFARMVARRNAIANNKKGLVYHKRKSKHKNWKKYKHKRS